MLHSQSSEERVADSQNIRIRTDEFYAGWCPFLYDSIDSASRPAQIGDIIQVRNDLRFNRHCNTEPGSEPHPYTYRKVVIPAAPKLFTSDSMKHFGSYLSSRKCTVGFALTKAFEDRVVECG
jgi:hypothetical protein